MTFISYFDKFHFYPYILYKFRVLKLSHLQNNNYEKFQIIPTKYPKHVEKRLGCILGYYRSSPTLVIFYLKGCVVVPCPKGNVWLNFEPWEATLV